MEGVAAEVPLDDALPEPVSGLPHWPLLVGRSLLRSRVPMTGGLLGWSSEQYYGGAFIRRSPEGCSECSGCSSVSGLLKWCPGAMTPHPSKHRNHLLNCEIWNCFSSWALRTAMGTHMPGWVFSSVLSRTNKSHSLPWRQAILSLASSPEFQTRDGSCSNMTSRHRLKLDHRNHI